MTPIDKAWLDERGGLHDSTLIAFSRNGPDFGLEFDDEWVNERGLTLPKAGRAPGKMLLRNASLVEGDLRNAEGGWIDCVDIQADVLKLQFHDRAALSFRVASAFWQAVGKANRT